MKRTLLLTFTAALLYVSLSSYNAGPSGTPQGVQTAKTGCGDVGCHGAAGSPGSNTSMAITIADKNAQTITDGKYNPGEKHTITLTDAGSASAFGYIALITDDATDAQAGTLANPSSDPNVKVTTKGAYTVVEQPSKFIPGSGNMLVTFEWTAPAAGAGAVTVYFAVNRANNNGSADAGDEYALKSVTLAEAGVSVENVASKLEVSVFPNPTTSTLHIDGIEKGNYNYAVYNVNGSIAAKGSLNGNTIDVSKMATGTYFLTLQNGEESSTVMFNKQ